MNRLAPLALSALFLSPASGCVDPAEVPSGETAPAPTPTSDPTPSCGATVSPAYFEEDGPYSEPDTGWPLSTPEIFRAASALAERSAQDYLDSVGVEIPEKNVHELQCVYSVMLLAAMLNRLDTQADFGDEEWFARPNETQDGIGRTNWQYRGENPVWDETFEEFIRPAHINANLTSTIGVSFGQIESPHESNPPSNFVDGFDFEDQLQEGEIGPVRVRLIPSINFVDDEGNFEWLNSFNLEEGGYDLWWRGWVELPENVNDEGEWTPSLPRVLERPETATTVFPENQPGRPCLAITPDGDCL